MTFTHEIKAEVISDSISPDGVRLTTISTTYNRFAMPEIMMHREQSRSSASSRAIPFETMLERAIQHPAPFVEYPAEQKGMQGGALLAGNDLYDAEILFEDIQAATVARLQQYIEDHPDKATRAHKSLLNRTLEWFSWTTTVLSATQWENYFRQRAHKDAQPEFRELAYKVRDAIAASTPVPLQWYDWHLPFIGERDDDLTMLERVKVSTARCARTSFLGHDGEFSHESDLRMYDATLAINGHWAPLEHPAVCIPSRTLPHYGNFRQPWHQLRHMVEFDEGGTHAVENIIARKASA